MTSTQRIRGLGHEREQEQEQQEQEQDKEDEDEEARAGYSMESVRNGGWLTPQSAYESSPEFWM